MTQAAAASPRPAVVLLSGGLDSATCLAIAKADGFDPIAISFRYGQRHDFEIEVASRIAHHAGTEQVICEIDLRTFGGSALTADIAVPKHDDVTELASAEIPITYVPARNTIFLSFALALAEVRGATDIFIGVNAVDYSGYPDCRPEFIQSFEATANLATRAGVSGTNALRIHTPLIALSKAQIITLGMSLGVDFAHTISCYDPSPDGLACGHCDSCLLRKKGFRDAGVVDPTTYQTGVGSMTTEA
ncbi:MAG: 7-cyano-7-deazaguanine synthase QueC [Actinomycetes bacterium]